MYEDSACWSVIFRDPAQSTSIFSQIPPLRQKVQPEEKDVPLTAHTLTTLHLVHLLLTHYPSQNEFQSTLSSSPLPSSSRTFLRSIASTIRRGNFIALSTLTDPQTSPLLLALDYTLLPTKALLAALTHLREVVRADAWRCVQSAYRDFSSQAEVKGWLTRALCLGGDVAAEEWMEGKVRDGEVGWKLTGNGWTVLRSRPATAK